LFQRGSERGKHARREIAELASRVVGCKQSSGMYQETKKNKGEGHVNPLGKIPGRGQDYARRGGGKDPGSAGGARKIS